MILERWSSDAFLIYIRRQVLEWNNYKSNDIIRNDSLFDATDVPEADIGDPSTSRSLPFNGDRPTFRRLHLFHRNRSPSRITALVNGGVRHSGG
jgi:hypothetical protein